MTDDQLAVAQELARREPPIIQALGNALRNEALERYYIAVLRRNERWTDAPRAPAREPGED